MEDALTASSHNAFNRRDFIQGALAGAAFAVLPSSAFSADNSDLQSVLSQIPKMHDENVKRLRDWIALPSIAAENRNYPQGPDYMAQLARDAGFTNVEIVPTSGKPGVFGLLDSGAAIRKKLPVNLVLVCEGEEEIGSTHFPEVVHQPKITAALKKCMGVFIPEAGQDEDGGVQISLGAKGVVELELVSTGERWGRGPKHDVHFSLEAQVDSPTWHLVQALNALIESDGHTPAVAGFFDKAKPLTPAQMKMIQEVAGRRSEATAKKQLGVEHWVHDTNWLDSLVLLESKPTINIEGLVAGYTGPGGKTVLPHRAVAKIDMRLVPDMTAAGTLALLKEHLAKHGFGDIEVNMSGGYDPTQTSQDSKLIQAQVATYRKLGLDPVLWPRSAGSWPGYIFTSEPLNLPAGHFGLGHGTGAHAPNEYYLIDSTNAKVVGIDGAVRSFVEYLYALS
jgi:acetylornithine deacetylase/succinyl-diaminopimelate desuccinylase-like protein